MTFSFSYIQSFFLTDKESLFGLVRISGLLYCKWLGIATQRQLLARVRQRNYGIKYHSSHTVHTLRPTENPSVPRIEGNI